MKIKVFQVNSDLDSHGTKFRDYDSVLKTAGRIDPSVYNTVFDGDVECEDLEDVYRLPGKIVLAVCGVVILITAVLMMKYTRPVEYKR